MKLTETNIPGAFVVDIEFGEDERGFFARTWDEKLCADRGLSPSHMVQSSTSLNHKRGTLRGMHFQKSPYSEAKPVRCTRGAIYYVWLDLRPATRPYTKWVAVELTAENRSALYIPEGCAHGFQTLEDETEILYMMSAYFQPNSEGGVRYDDPAFAIRWPLMPTLVSERDRTWPDWKKT